jgi:hypothetical protein
MPSLTARITRTVVSGSDTPVARSIVALRMVNTEVLTAIASESPTIVIATAPGVLRKTRKPCDRSWMASLASRVPDRFQVQRLSTSP